MTNQNKAYTYGLVTVALWSTIATASKLTLGILYPAELLLIAAIVSAMVLLVIVWLQGKFHLVLRVSPGDMLLSAGYGVLNPLLYYLVLFEAYRQLPAQQAQIINYTWAITLTLLSIPFLGQKVSRLQWLAIITSYSGVLVIATRGNVLSLQFDNPMGVILALLSTVLWASYWILNTRDRRDPVVGLLLNFLCALPFIAGYVYLVHGYRPLPFKGLLGAAYIGVFEMGISFVLWLLALKYTKSAARIANLIFIAPFLSLVLIHFFVGEQIYKSTLAGLALVVGGLVLQAKGRSIEL